MKKLCHKVLYSMIGASGALAGMLPAARCGGHCTTCFGCAGIGLGIVLVLVGKKIKGHREEFDGRV